MSQQDCTAQNDHSRRYLPALAAAGVVFAVLLALDLGGRGLWTDEDISLGFARGNVSHIFADAFHPPGYYALLRAWLQWSDSDAWLRAFSLPWALLAWLFMWLIARELGLRREGLLAAWLLALSPYALTYYRIGRYYSLAAAAVMFCLYGMVRFTRAPSWGNAGLCALSLGITAYVDYVALVLVLALYALYLLVALWRRKRRHTLRLLAAAAAGLATAVPIFVRLKRDTGVVAAIEANPLAGSLQGFVIKLSLPFFSLGTGESIGAWRFGIVIPACAAATLLLAAGAVYLYRRGPVGRLLTVAWPLNILVAVMLMSTVAATTPINRSPSFTTFTLPIAVLLMAVGITHFRPRLVGIIAGAAVFAAYGLGLWNYFHKQELMNPGFAPPWREVAAVIEQHEEPGDELFTTDSVLSRYYSGPMILQHFDALERAVEEGRPMSGRVWMVGRDRGYHRAWEMMNEMRTQYLQAGAREEIFRFGERSEAEQRLLTRMLRRPAWDAYIRVHLFIPPDETARDVADIPANGE